jgi:hypothetical protein
LSGRVGATFPSPARRAGSCVRGAEDDASCSSFNRPPNRSKRRRRSAHSVDRGRLFLALPSMSGEPKKSRKNFRPTAKSLKSGASSLSATKDYAPLGFLFGGILAYRAIMCRFEESTIESMLHKSDLDCVLELLLENRQRELEERREELRRPPTDAELARRGNIIRGMQKRFEAHRLRAGRRADINPSRPLSSSC